MGLANDLISGGTAAFYEVFNKVDISAEYIETLSDTIVERLTPVTASLLTFNNSIIHLDLDGDSPPSKANTSLERQKIANKNLYSCMDRILSSKCLSILTIKGIFRVMPRENQGRKSRAMQNFLVVI